MATANLKPERSHSMEDGEFIVFPDVPVFKTHTTRDGHEIDELALRKICQNCNDRIRDTGDFPPLVLRHTTDDGERDPEVVGFVGPYRLGKVGRLHPKPAILAHLRIFKPDADKARKYPRLSVEYWANEDDPTNGYFDPISLLGAETPELDLGIRYSRGHGGQRVMRYAKVERFSAMPGGSNTFIPGGGIPVSENDKKQPYQKGSTTMLSPEDIQQIVVALKPVVAEQVATMMPPASAPADAEMGESESTEGLEDKDSVADQDMDLDDESDDVGELGDDLDDNDEDDNDADDKGKFGKGGMDADSDAPRGLEDDGDNDEDDMPASKPDHYSKLAKYAACGDHDSGSRYAKDLDDDSRAAVSARLDDEGDEDIKMRLQKYMAIPDHDGDESATVRQYRRERNSYRERYRKEKAGHEALRKRYAKLKADHDTLAKKERRAVRYAKLTELNQDGYSFDPDEEADDCESMDNAQFERHVQRIQQRYQRIPLGGIPIPRSPMRDGVSTDEKRQRYAKQASANVQAARARGEKIEYKQELERLLAADGKPDKAA